MDTLPQPMRSSYSYSNEEQNSVPLNCPRRPVVQRLHLDAIAVGGKNDGSARPTCCTKLVKFTARRIGRDTGTQAYECLETAFRIHACRGMGMYTWESCQVKRGPTTPMTVYF